MEAAFFAVLGRDHYVPLAPGSPNWVVDAASHVCRRADSPDGGSTETSGGGLTVFPLLRVAVDGRWEVERAEAHNAWEPLPSAVSARLRAQQAAMASPVLQGSSVVVIVDRDGVHEAGVPRTVFDLRDRVVVDLTSGARRRLRFVPSASAAASSPGPAAVGAPPPVDAATTSVARVPTVKCEPPAGGLRAFVLSDDSLDPIPLGGTSDVDALPSPSSAPHARRRPADAAAPDAVHQVARPQPPPAAEPQAAAAPHTAYAMSVGSASRGPPAAVAPVSMYPLLRRDDPRVPRSDGTRRLLFPSISTSVFKFDVNRAAQVAAIAIATFLSKHPAHRSPNIEISLIDYSPTGAETETTRAFAKAWMTIGAPDPRFNYALGDVQNPHARGRCFAVVNAANNRLAGGASTSGFNRAVHLAAGAKELEAASRAAHGPSLDAHGGAVVGRAYPVRIGWPSKLKSESGVEYVVHVVGPNMNPARPDCLFGDYDAGCKLLRTCYDNILNWFASVHGLTAA